MLIFGTRDVTLDAISKNYDATVSTLFRTSIAPAVWCSALDYGIDPVGAVAQSAHETGWGTFKRATQPWHFNTAGIKVRDLKALEAIGISGDSHPLVHAQFASWRQGATAHMQHLWALAGRRVPPAQVVDPRYDWVVGRYALTDFEQLGDGKWAPAPDYGLRIVAVANKLLGR